MNGTTPQPDLTVADLQRDPWCIVQCATRSFIGRATGEDPRSGAIVLSPAFEYVSQLSIDPRRGEAQRMVLVFPVEMMGASEIRVRPEALVFLKHIDEKGLAGLHAKLSQAMGVVPRAGGNRIVMPGAQ